MSSSQTQGPGRAFLVYSALRLVLLVVAYSVTQGVVTAVGSRIVAAIRR